jgi:hypothetical protein
MSASNNGGTAGRHPVRRRGMTARQYHALCELEAWLASLGDKYIRASVVRERFQATPRSLCGQSMPAAAPL